MSTLITALAIAATGATIGWLSGALTPASARAAADASPDYTRFQIAPGIYPADPRCLAAQEAGSAWGCGQTLYIDCEGTFGPPAPCDDPDYWIDWF